VDGPATAVPVRDLERSGRRLDEAHPDVVLSRQKPLDLLRRKAGHSRNRYICPESSRRRVILYQSVLPSEIYFCDSQLFFSFFYINPVVVLSKIYLLLFVVYQHRIIMS